MPDHCAPALAAIAARKVLDPQLVHGAVAPVANYLREQPRNRLGALNHLGTDTSLARVYPSSIWIDSLMMYASTAVVVGQVVGDRALTEFGLQQPAIFADLLQDDDTGLFRHAYLDDRDRTRPRRATFWLRGNGWVAAALVDMLTTPHGSQSVNQTIFVKLARSLMARQEGGLWSTVINDRRTYREPSGSALVAYALAKATRLGVLGPQGRTRAHATFAALVASLRVRDDGLSLPGVSGPTIPGSRAAYAIVPRRADIDYGVGALCLLAAELAR